MRIELRTKTEFVKQPNGHFEEKPFETLIEGEIDCTPNSGWSYDIVRWRDQDFVYQQIEGSKAIYVRATGTTINWYPNSTGEPFKG